MFLSLDIPSPSGGRRVHPDPLWRPLWPPPAETVAAGILEGISDGSVGAADLRSLYGLQNAEVAERRTNAPLEHEAGSACFAS
jgi:hypothetical protein